MIGVDFLDQKDIRFGSFFFFEMECWPDCIALLPAIDWRRERKIVEKEKEKRREGKKRKRKRK